MAEPLFDVSGHVVLVAGGARGLGRGLASGLAARGARIVLADRLADEAIAAVGTLPGAGHLACALDVTDPESVDAAIADARRHGGRIDAVLNSAGIARFAPALDLSAEDFAGTMAVNVTGAFLLSRSAARVMAEQETGGRIVHLASVSSRVVNEQYAAYSTSKAALAQLVKLLGLEWARTGITVNAIGPAVTRTPLTEATILADPAMTEQALAQIPMGRFGECEDLIATVLLLMSEGGRFITGQTVYVDGGRTLN
jgi:NAD(P)-dependent dehydrogenase (short-subunit alcohol dehydrogenase family)